MAAFVRMKPLVTKIEKNPQGNKNHVARALEQINQKIIYDDYVWYSNH